MKVTLAFSLPILLLSVLSCKPSADELPVPVVYNGFTTGGTYYEVDSVRYDYTGSGSTMHLYSSTKGGAVVDLRTRNRTWPFTDGTYYYIFNNQWTQDSSAITACFVPKDSTSKGFCVDDNPQTGSTPALEVVRVNNKLTVRMGARPDNYSNAARYLEINYTDK